MSHGTVHDNTPKASPGVGMIEMKIHDDLNPTIERVKRSKFYTPDENGSTDDEKEGTYKHSTDEDKYRYLPRYVPFISTDDKKRYETDDEVNWEDSPTVQYYLIPAAVLTKGQKTKMKKSGNELRKIGVIVDPKPDTETLSPESKGFIGHEVAKSENGGRASRTQSLKTK